MGDMIRDLDGPGAGEGADKTALLSSSRGSTVKAKRSAGHLARCRKGRTHLPCSIAYRQRYGALRTLGDPIGLPAKHALATYFGSRRIEATALRRKRWTGRRS